ncbi:MAG: hypothetical protein K8L99_31895, partial [Anaerolineae bacterium]|nr:hypothetical protein [Anaerolineae bacterium]
TIYEDTTILYNKLKITFLVAAKGRARLLLWYRIYERNRFWGEVCNETARDIEKLLMIDGPAHAFMKGDVDNKVALKNTDISGAAYSGKEALPEVCSAGSIHKSIYVVMWVLAFALLAAGFIGYEI